MLEDLSELRHPTTHDGLLVLLIAKIVYHHHHCESTIIDCSHESDGDLIAMVMKCDESTIERS